MAAGLFLLTSILMIASLLLALLMIAPSRRRLATANEQRYPRLAAQAHRIQKVRLVALGAGILAVLGVAPLGSLGIGLCLVPATFAVVQVLGVVAAEQLGRAAARTPGTAGLETRLISAYLPRGLTVAVGALLLATTAYFTWSTFVAVPDDLGRVGRSFEFTYADPNVGGGAGPFPGSYYTVPMAIGLGVLVLIALFALTVITRRPRNGADPDLVAADDILRLRAAESVIAATGTGFAGTLFGSAAVVTAILLPKVLNPTAEVNGVVIAPILGLSPWVSLVLVVAALALGAWCVTVLLVPGAAREPRPPARNGAEPARERTP